MYSKFFTPGGFDSRPNLKRCGFGDTLEVPAEVCCPSKTYWALYSLVVAALFVRGERAMAGISGIPQVRIKGQSSGLPEAAHIACPHRVELSRSSG